MMITAHKNNQAKRISGPIKLDIALQAIRRQQTVSEISKHFNCSRTTVYKQQDKALDAAIVHHDFYNLLKFIWLYSTLSTSKIKETISINSSNRWCKLLNKLIRNLNPVLKTLRSLLPCDFTFMGLSASI